MTESKFRERRSAFRDESAVTEAVPPEATTATSAEPQAAEPQTAHESTATGPAGADAVPAPTIPTPDSPTSPEAEPTEPDFDRLAGMHLPEPSFLELVERHVEDALRFLGQLPLTPQGDRRLLPELARHEIDLLGILEQRTRGNLPPEEKEYLEQALDHLRTLYLRIAR